MNQTLARDVMSSNLVTIHPDETNRRAVELLTQNRLTGLPVIDRQGKLLGLLSEKDILSSCQSIEEAGTRFLDQAIAYRKKIRTVQVSTPIDRVSAILSGKSFRHIPVVDTKGVLKGIITRRDLIRVLYLRIELSRKKPRREG